MYELILELRENLRPLLEASALILSLVNGLLLLKYYLRDKPKLEVKPHSPGGLSMVVPVTRRHL